MEGLCFFAHIGTSLEKQTKANADAKKVTGRVGEKILQEMEEKKKSHPDAYE